MFDVHTFCIFTSIQGLQLVRWFNSKNRKIFACVMRFSRRSTIGLILCCGSFDCLRVHCLPWDIIACTLSPMLTITIEYHQDIYLHSDSIPTNKRFVGHGFRIFGITPAFKMWYLQCWFSMQPYYYENTMNELKKTFIWN